MRRSALIIGFLLLVGACTSAVDEPAPSVTSQAPTTTMDSSPRTTAPTTTSTVAETTTTVLSREDMWREDIFMFVEALESIHPAPFWRADPDLFFDDVESLLADIPGLTDPEVIVRLMSLANRIDGHTQLSPTQRETGFLIYPLKFYVFADGLFLIDAPDANADLVGAPLVSISGVPIGDVIEAVRPLIFHDNDATIDLLIPLFIINAGILEVLGIVDDPMQPGFELATVEGLVSLDVDPISRDDWTETLDDAYPAGLPNAENPLTLRYLHQARMWWTFLDGDDTVYIQLNEVRGSGSDETGESVQLSDLVAEISDFLDNEDPAKVVLDIRHNPGGNNRTYGLLLSLLQDPRVDRPGRLFVITGRQTFSAATNLATEIEGSTSALFVGEPTGGSPNLYGDTESVRLRNSQLSIQISGLYWEFSTPDDTRPWIEPDVSAPLSSTDYFRGIDPALEAVLAYSG